MNQNGNPCRIPVIFVCHDTDMNVASIRFFRFRPTIARAWLGAILFAWSMLAHAAPQDQPKTITVALDDNFPPYIFRNQSGQLQGIQKDIWDLWSAKTGIAVRFIATDWARAQQVMQANHADVLDTLYKTDDRTQKLVFSEPYAKLDTAIFFHKTISGIQSVNDLRGFAVGVKEGGATSAWLAAKGAGELRRYPSYEALIRAAANDEIRVFFMEKPPALHYLFKHGLENDFRYSDTQYTGQFHWATRKGDVATHQRVERGFSLISASERARIENRWLGSSMRNIDNERYIRYTVIALVVGALVSGALLLLSWTLRRKVSARTAELSSAMEALRASERDGRMLFETSMLGLMLCRMDGTIVDANQACADIVGRTIPEMLKLTYWQITPAEYAKREQQQLDSLKTTGHYGPYEKEYIHKSGKRVPVRMSGRLIERRGEQFIWSSIEDITQSRATEERINFLAFHDALTGLP
ncbi:MAG: gmr 10, partial [Burkholderiaceae bacterium]|nr:gmr 10 [Burkholderiaceae bacterium]